jgi:hypothetical protein
MRAIRVRDLEVIITDLSFIFANGN